MNRNEKQFLIVAITGMIIVSVILYWILRPCWRTEGFYETTEIISTGKPGTDGPIVFYSDVDFKGTGMSFSNNKVPQAPPEGADFWVKSIRIPSGYEVTMTIKRGGNTTERVYKTDVATLNFWGTTGSVGVKVTRGTGDRVFIRRVNTVASSADVPAPVPAPEPATKAAVEPPKLPDPAPAPPPVNPVCTLTPSDRPMKMMYNGKNYVLTKSPIEGVTSGVWNDYMSGNDFTSVLPNGSIMTGLDISSTTQYDPGSCPNYKVGPACLMSPYLDGKYFKSGTNYYRYNHANRKFDPAVTQLYNTSYYDISSKTELVKGCGGLPVQNTVITF